MNWQRLVQKRSRHPTQNIKKSFSWRATRVYIYTEKLQENQPKTTGKKNTKAE